MTARKQVATVTFDHAPTASELEAVEAAYVDEGFTAPLAIAMPHDDRATTGWDARVVADVPGPYARRIE